MGITMGLSWDKARKSHWYLAIKRGLLVGIWIGGVFLTQACSGGGSSSGPDFNALGGGFSPGEVEELFFNSQNQATATFSELSGTEEFVFLLYSGNADEGPFNIQLNSQNDLPTTKYLGDTLEGDVSLQDLESDPTSEFHEFLRHEEEKLVGMQPYSPEKEIVSDSQTCQNGGTYFKVLNNLSNTQSYDVVCAIPVRQTTQAIYYVDDRVLNDVPSSLINPIIDQFDPGIIRRERDLIGGESDVNQDGLFSVLITPTVNQAGAILGGFITGYFYGGDLFSGSNSNQREIFYVCAPDPSGKYGIALSQSFWASNIFGTVLPHEFQHLISFNQHVFIHQGSPEVPWANEGLSHFMEDLANDLQSVSIENISRVASFMNTPDIAFTRGTSIAQRAGAYLFFRRIYEQAHSFPGAPSGEQLLKELLDTSLTGVENIENATGVSFQDLLLDFYTAVLLSNTGLNSKYDFSGINLHSTYDDNRNTVLDGVKTVPLSSLNGQSSIAGSGAIFFSTTAGVIQNAGHEVHFTGGANMFPGGAIIRVK